MIALTDVHKAFGAKQVLRGLTLDVARAKAASSSAARAPANRSA